MLITVTEASRNFAECVNRVRYQGASFLLQKNGSPVARLIPVVFEGSDEPGRVAARDVEEPRKTKNAAERSAVNSEAVEPSQGKPAGHDPLNW